jgi:solute carrier family 35 protein C2
LIGVVLVIALGEFLTVAGEIHFDAIGFFMCLSASILSGARWTLVQLKLHSLDPPLKTTIATMRVLSPSMFFSMLFVALVVEKPWETLSSGYFETVSEGLRTLGMGLIGATFAVAMIICEFYLIMRASAIVLMIGGVIKEMITIIVGYVANGVILVVYSVFNSTLINVHSLSQG